MRPAPMEGERIIEQVTSSTFVVHANWSDDRLALWAETTTDSGAPPAGDRKHPFCAPAADLLEILGLEVPHQCDTLLIGLPSGPEAPQPSPHLAHAIGHSARANGNGAATSDIGSGSAIEIRQWVVHAIRCSPLEAPRVLERVEELSILAQSQLVDESTAHEEPLARHVIASDSLRCFAQASRFALALVAQQRVVPTLVPTEDQRLDARWRPWLADKVSAAPFHEMVDAMPPAARAAVDRFEHDPTAILESFLGQVIDAHVRSALTGDRMIDALDGWTSGEDPQVAWLSGLLDAPALVQPVEDRPGAMARTIRRWIARLEDRGPAGEWRLLLRMQEPGLTSELEDLQEPDETVIWHVTFHLHSVEAASLVIDAEDVWTLRTESATVAGRHVEAPREMLLKELGRAARVYPELGRALEDAAPTGIELDTIQAYDFLREIRPILEEQGISVSAPDWWDAPSARIGARLEIEAPESVLSESESSAPGSAGPSRLGLDTLVGYRWNIAVGPRTLTLDEFVRLAELKAPLVQVGGQWVEVRPADVRAAVQFIGGAPGGTMSIGEALRMALATDLDSTGVPILGIDAQGWLERLLQSEDGARMPQVAPPEGFHGTLRPYQVRGLRWLSFLDQLGLGACLADDMGLGKTIQLLALLLHERNGAARADGAEPVRPTLLVVPMSIVSNWKREAERFAPSLRVLVHHGIDRFTGTRFRREAAGSDLVVTTYALAHRDRETLELLEWGRVVLDEAQNIKNPSAKQTQAVKSFAAPRRITLTGTPLENRLTELWSIMEFCNAGLLGTMGDFRRRFAIPIERRRNRQRSAQLRSLVRPFILRRLKTDPSVISDLPEKVETKEYCTLTAEQASLYESCVRDLLEHVDQSDGIRRRGIVLTSLVRLKQVCDHPALVPGAEQSADHATALASRSGKCIRLIEMLEEIVASGAQALVFTQFRRMGELLAGMLSQALDRDILLFHGGTSPRQRERIIERFQQGGQSSPVLVLSLRAGGVGLNLTAATHVFHFDRWWNPAVENQATDRAFRIGQTRTVNVHKFIVNGTLEDRIDQMIESKIALAEDIIGAGEDWLTELSTAQLKDILALRPEAIGDAP